MDKIRLSNAKTRLKSNKSLSLQEKEEFGDGIQTLTENFKDDEPEELDYEDDLSVEEEPDQQFLAEDPPRVDSPPASPKLGTSTETSQVRNLAAEQDEEKLMNNPVIQRMMVKFFNEQFKDMEKG